MCACVSVCECVSVSVCAYVCVCVAGGRVGGNTIITHNDDLYIVVLVIF